METWWEALLPGVLWMDGCTLTLLRREVLALWLQERFKFMELFYGIANRLDELMDQNQRKGQ